MAIMGGLFVGVSLLLASFATTYWQLLLTQGVMFGIACPIAYFPALTIISHYFDKRKGFATGIAVSGSGIGGLAISPIVLFPSVFLKPRLKPSTRGKMNYVKILTDHSFIRLFLITAVSSLGYFIHSFIDRAMLFTME
jgi:MFS family permease